MGEHYLENVGKACIQKISQPAASFFSWAGCEIAKTNIIFVNSFYVAYLCDVICGLRRMSLHHDCCCLMMSLRGLHQTKRLRGFHRTMMNLFQTMSCLMMSYGWEPNRQGGLTMSCYDHHRMKTMSLHGLHQTMMMSCYGWG